MSDFEQVCLLVKEIRRDRALGSDSEAFIHLCLARILKLADETINQAVTSGEGDGGVDAFVVDRKEAHICLCDYAPSVIESKHRIPSNRLRSFIGTWLAIASSREGELVVNDALRRQIIKLQEGFRLGEGYFRCTFHFFTNREYSGIPRAKTERQMNYYESFNYRYYELRDLASALCSVSGIRQDIVPDGLLERALIIERTDVKTALKLFERYEKRNALIYFDLLPLAILGPVIVTLLAYFAGRMPSLLGKLAIAGILLAGYLPLYVAFMGREVDRGYEKPSGPWHLILLSIFFADVIAGPAIILVFILAVAAIIGLVTILPIRLIVPPPWPAGVEVFAEAILVLLASSWVFSGLKPPIPRFRYLPGEIIAGIKRNTGEIFRFATGLVMTVFIVAGGFLGQVYGHLWQALIVGAFSGLMMGLGCRSHLSREPRLQNLGLLGQARCLVRLGRGADSSRRLRELSESLPSTRPLPIESLAEAVSGFEGRWLEENQNRYYASVHPLEAAEQSAGPLDVPDSVWKASLSNTWLMIGEEALTSKPSNELLRIMRDTNCPAWRRICAAEALSEGDDPRFHIEPTLCGLPNEPLLGFVRIPEGPFLARTRVKGGSPERIFLSTYFIARYPTTIHQIRAYLREESIILQSYPRLRQTYSRPFPGLIWREAVSYCEWLTARLKKVAGSRLAKETHTDGRIFWGGLASGELIVTLPSESEWEKAAGGIDGRQYPWGDDPDPDRANFAETGIRELVPVGCFPNGASPYGVEDLLGADLTWTRSLFDSPASATPSSNIRAGIGTMAVRGTAPRWSARNVSLAYRAPLSRDNSFGAGVRLVVSGLGPKGPA